MHQVEILKLLDPDYRAPFWIQNTIMPTLQQMHKNTAASPRSTAKLFLLLEELSYRHLYSIDSGHLGRYHINAASGMFAREDDFATSGFPGLAGFASAFFKCLEAQARGFCHGHGKVHSIPSSMRGLYVSLENVVREI